MDRQTKQVTFRQTAKSQDADAFLLDAFQTFKPSLVCIDAPLSLPGVYRNPAQYADYFYRTGDRQLQAMSPMFLGGLTARAMQLKAALFQSGIAVYETYPAAQARRMQLIQLGYKKEKVHIPMVIEEIKRQTGLTSIDAGNLQNWHQVDALLALIGAIRFYHHAHETYGEEAEGVIII